MNELIVLRDEIEAYINSEQLKLTEESKSFDELLDEKPRLKWNDEYSCLKLRLWLRENLERIKRDPQKKSFQSKFAGFIFKLEIISAIEESHKLEPFYFTRPKRVAIESLLKAKLITEGYLAARDVFDGDFKGKVEEIYGRYQKNSEEQNAQSLSGILFTELKEKFKENLITHVLLLKSFELLNKEATAATIVGWVKKENKKLHKNDVERKKLLAEFGFKLAVLDLLENFGSKSSEVIIRSVIANHLGVVLSNNTPVGSGGARFNKVFLFKVEERKKKYDKYLEKLSSRPVGSKSATMVVKSVKVVVEAAAKAPESKASFFPVVSPKEKEERTPISVFEPVVQDEPCDVGALKQANKTSEQMVDEIRKHFLRSMQFQLANKLAGLEQVRVALEKIDYFRAEYADNANNSLGKKVVAKKVAKRGWDYIPFGIGNWFAKKFGAADWDERSKAVEKYFETEIDRDVISEKLRSLDEDCEFAVKSSVERGNFRGINADSFQAIFTEISKIKVNNEKIAKQKKQTSLYKPYVISVVEQNGPRSLSGSFSPNSSFEKQ